MSARYARRAPGAILSLLLCVIVATAIPASTQAKAASVLCVLVPHFKDDYWLSVAFGLEQEADIQNVELILFEAGGYQAKHAQIEQIGDCAARDVDGILIGAVSSDDAELLDALSQAATSTKVFGLVNELHSDVLSGRVGVDWRDMGHSLGRHLSVRFPQGRHGKTAVLISGPPESGWVAPLEKGLRDGLSESAVEIVEVYSADTGLREQLDLVQAALRDHPDVDLLIGSAPAIEAAMGVSANGNANAPRPQLFATYVSHSVKRGLLYGSVAAAPFDDPTMQGILAIKQAVTALDKDAHQGANGPRIILLEHSTVQTMDVPVSPPGFFPDLK